MLHGFDDGARQEAETSVAAWLNRLQSWKIRILSVYLKLSHRLHCLPILSLCFAVLTDEVSQDTNIYSIYQYLVSQLVSQFVIYPHWEGLTLAQHFSPGSIAEQDVSPGSAVTCI